MRTIIATLVSLVLFSTVNLESSAQSLDDLEFPYNALVLRDNAPIRSGPGTVHYATDKLDQGQTVEVYRHDPGNWCAIRPPAGAFSLVPESAVEIVEDNVGKIVTGSAQAWVGTRLGSVDSPLWQIKMKQDELVEILGEVSWPNPEGHSTIWYQIAPPAGEFRWIQMADLQLPDDATNLERLKSPNRGVIAQSSGSGIPSPAPQTIAAPLATATSAPQRSIYDPPSHIESFTTHAAKNQPATRLRNQPTRQSISNAPQIQDSLPDNPTKSLNSGWRRAQSQMEKEAAIGQHASTERPNEFTSPAVPSDVTTDTYQANGFATPIQGSIEPIDNSRMTQVVSANMQIEESPERTASIADKWDIIPAQSSSTHQTLPSGPVTSQLRSLEFSLTNEMLKQPTEWKLDELLLKAESLRDSAQSPADTQQANRLIGKLKKCKTIRSSYRDAYNDSPTANTGSERSIRGPIGTGIDSSVELGTNYDAHGFLNELVRDKGSIKSTYVLQDSSGQITHHIAPAPGVNLHRYIGSKVGIVGKRGYHQRLNLDHVTAERVVEIQKLR